MSLRPLYQYIGTRRKICYYRFDQILSQREKYFKNDTNQARTQNDLNTARTQVIKAVDTYINCLRNQYEQDLPEQFVPTVQKFKKMAYEQLRPAFELQNHTNQILKEFYNVSR